MLKLNATLFLFVCAPKLMNDFSQISLNSLKSMMMLSYKRSGYFINTQADLKSHYSDEKLILIAVKESKNHIT